MMTKRWQYQKADSKKEPDTPSVKNGQIERRETIVPLDVNLPVTYTKQDGAKESFLFIIISGGEKREIDYFSEIERERMGMRIKLITLSATKGAGGLSPQLLYGYALNAFYGKYVEKENRRLYLQENDRFYLLTDVDQFIELDRIVYLCRYRRFNLVISNPCFEVWLYYSYFNQPEKDLTSLRSDDSKVSRKLKYLNGILKPGGIDPRKAIGELETAIKNSMERYKEKRTGFPDFLTTQMFLLGKEIKEKLHDDLIAWRQKEQERIQAYKRKLQ